MPAGPVADPPWETGSWADDAWEAESWGEAVVVNLPAAEPGDTWHVPPRETRWDVPPRETTWNVGT
jgi:hypothetical protein